MLDGVKFLIVGAGFSGCVMAERIARVLNERVLLIDKRPFCGGNSYSEIDDQTGIECHKYGSHIFHTHHKNVWDYILQFADFTNYQHKVLIQNNGRVYFMPINLKTINDFFHQTFTPHEAYTFLQQEKSSFVVAPVNLEEKAISLIGDSLYKALIKSYTQKQWGREPAELPADIITRLPVRYNYNTNYFSDPYQGVPREGYGKLFKKMITHDNITVQLGVDFFEIRNLISNDCNVIFTGQIDQYFECCLGALDWRSLYFEWETHNIQDYQGTAVMNFADIRIPYTRIHEFKHYHCERTEIFNSQQTIICKEFPQEHHQGLEAYYPVADAKNQSLLEEYQKLSMKLPNIHFLGRLGTYQYLDMDKAIMSALSYFYTNFASQHNSDVGRQIRTPC